MASDDMSSTRRFSTSSYEKELPLAAEFKEGIEFVISKCFQYLQLHNFKQAFPEVNEELLKRLHDQMITNLHTFITEKIAEVLDETQIINSLNELYTLTQNQPLTFTNVWRPTGDPEVDLEAHIQGVTTKYQTIFTDMLNDLKQENNRKWAEIEKAEAEIIKLQEEITQTTDRLKAAELAASMKIKVKNSY